MSDLLCRLCLSTEHLKPIFEKYDETFSDVLALTTGLQININDGLPQQICLTCQDLVHSSVTLRNQSRTSEIKLLHMGYKRKGDTNDNNISREQKRSPSERSVELNNDSKDWSFYCNVTDTETDEVELKDENYFAQIVQIKPVVAVKKSSRKEKRQEYLNLVEGTLNPNGPVKCKVCKKTVNKWSSFVCHAKLHLGLKYVCELIIEKEMEQERRETQIGRRVYCGKSFISSTQLNRHCRSYHGMQRELSCTHCNYLALDKAQLILHERRLHTGERPFVCDHCGASYYSRRCLIQHLESHQTHTNVQCERCHQLFKSRRHLARHTYNAHTSKEFTYKCPVCKQVYRNYKYIRVHLKKLHGLTTRDAQIIKIKL